MNDQKKINEINIADLLSEAVKGETNLDVVFSTKVKTRVAKLKAVYEEKLSNSLENSARQIEAYLNSYDSDDEELLKLFGAATSSIEDVVYYRGLYNEVEKICERHK